MRSPGEHGSSVFLELEEELHAMASATHAEAAQSARNTLLIRSIITEEPTSVEYFPRAGDSLTALVFSSY
jgi:hypothetical protein